jgi:hypothetical protein
MSIWEEREIKRLVTVLYTLSMNTFYQRTKFADV